MTSALAISVLGWPAMFAAGLASSAHCALMCGLLHGRVRGSARWGHHAGRLLAYALLGAIAGGLGHGLLRMSRWTGEGEVIRGLGLLVTVGMLLRSTRLNATRTCCAPYRASGQGQASAIVAGFVGGAVPCTLLYVAASYAALSASAVQGALLLLSFGAGTVPAVSLGAWGWRRLASGAFGASAIAVRARLLAGIALSGFVLFGLGSMVNPSWCVP